MMRLPTDTLTFEEFKTVIARVSYKLEDCVRFRCVAEVLR